MLDIFHALAVIAMWSGAAWAIAYFCIFLYAVVVGPSNKAFPPDDWKDNNSANNRPTTQKYQQNTRQTPH